MLQYKNVLPEECYADMAIKTEGYSGSDIKNICLEACNKCKLKVIAAHRFMKVKHK
jgi:SpoVK/Ycf46/Vps4 family AAA+-type ATPase